MCQPRTCELNCQFEPWFPYEGRVPHISLVFREIWDTADVDC